MPATYYDILEIHSDATTDEIKQAYRRLAKRVHPDTSASDDATKLFRDLQQAYETLVDAKQRRLYDARLAAERAPHERLVPFTLQLLASHTQLPLLAEQQMLYVLAEIKANENFTPLRAPLNICLVLDHSLSMEGTRIAQAKEAALYLIDRLDKQDILSVVAFGDRARVIVSAQSDADRSVAKTSVRTIQPCGGTELLQGISAGLDEVRRARRFESLDHLILITDGQTYGDETGCLEAADAAAREKIGLTLLGLGADWNDELLDEMAARSGGYSTFIDSPARLTAAFHERFAELTNVMARDVQLNFRLHESVLLKDVFRLTPDIARVRVSENCLPLGALEARRTLRVLIALSVNAARAGTLRALRAEASGELLNGSQSRQSIDAELAVTLSADIVTTASVPREIEDALARIAVFKVQEKAQADLARGDHARATTRMQNLATHLLNFGEVELARAALLEAGELNRTGQMSAEGRKRIRYGTRGLSHSLASDRKLP